LQNSYFITHKAVNMCSMLFVFAKIQIELDHFCLTVLFEGRW